MLGWPRSTESGSVPGGADMGHSVKGSLIRWRCGLARSCSCCLEIVVMLLNSQAGEEDTWALRGDS
jgi:hypothetical protein